MKISKPSNLTDEGIVIFSNDIQPENASDFIIDNEDGTSTLFNEKQPSKVDSSIVFTRGGIVNSFKKEHL